MFRIFLRVFAIASITAASTPVRAQALSTVLSGDTVTTYYAAAAHALDDIEYVYPPAPASPANGWSHVSGTRLIPTIAPGSPIEGYVQSLLGVPEEFYLTSTSGGLDIEQLSGTGLTPLDVTSATAATNAIAHSNLVGFIDSCASTDNVFYLGIDHHVHALIWGTASAPSPAQPGWSTVDLMTLVTTKNASMVSLTAHETSNSEEVFYIGADRHLHELWRWSGCSGGPAYDGWHATDVTLANSNGSPKVGFNGLTSLFDSSSAGTLDAVFFIDASEHLNELYLSSYLSPGQWTHVDVSAQTGQDVGSKSALASQMTPIGTVNFEHENVYFLDANQNVWDAVATPGSGQGVVWTALNLTVSANAAVAAAGTPLSVDDDQIICGTVPDGCGTAGDYGLRKEVYYVGPDKHVHLLGQQNSLGTAWTETDLTAATGAPKAIQ